MNQNPNELSNESQALIDRAYKKLYVDKVTIPVLGLTEQPTINRVLVLPDPVSSVTKSGIHIPDTAKDRPEVGTVLAIGPGRISEHGALIPCCVQVGDRVKYGKYAGSWVYDEESELHLLLMLDGDCITHKRGPAFLFGVV